MFPSVVAGFLLLLLLGIIIFHHLWADNLALFVSREGPRHLPTMVQAAAVGITGLSRPVAVSLKQPLPIKPHVNYSAMFMPAFHISSPAGTWMNDPNGMLDWAGVRHVFYQFNPAAPVWGPMHWGHVASRDLVRWMRLPVALAPSKWWDEDGVFSGSAGVTPGNEQPYLFYTGVSKKKELGYHYQLQALATPADAKDPLLVNWIKPDENPVNMDIPPGGTNAQFRDPVTPWSVDRALVEDLLPGLIASLENKQAHFKVHENSKSWSKGLRTIMAFAGEHQKTSSDGQQEKASVFFTAVGTFEQCVGSASLYASDDLRDWRYVGRLMSEVGLNSTEADDTSSASSKASAAANIQKHDCDPFAKTCPAWECPDYFQLDNIQVFKFSDQVRGRSPFGMDWYLLSDSAGLNLSCLDKGGEAFTATLGGRPYRKNILDYGTVYASKAFQLQDGKHIWLGWVYEDSEGCSEMAGEGSPFVIEHQKWQGMQTLPRHVTFDATSSSLHFFPVPELQTLRLAPALYDGGVVRLETAAKSQTFRYYNGADDGDGQTRQAYRRRQVHSEPYSDSWQQAHCDSQHVPAGSPGAASLLLVPEQPSPSGPGRRQLEIRAAFGLGTLPLQPGGRSVSAPFQAGITLMTGNNTFTRIFLRGTATWRSSTDDEYGNSSQGSSTPSKLTPIVDQLDIVVDRTCSGGATNNRMTMSSSTNQEAAAFQAATGGMAMPSAASWQGGPVLLPKSGLPAVVAGPCMAKQYTGNDTGSCWGSDPWGGVGGPADSDVVLPLSLAVWVDASVLEVFAMGGSARVTSRIYPFEDEVAWGVQLFARCGMADVTARAQVHELGSCWVDAL